MRVHVGIDAGGLGLVRLRAWAGALARVLLPPLAAMATCPLHAWLCERGGQGAGVWVLGHPCWQYRSGEPQSPGKIFSECHSSQYHSSVSNEYRLKLQPCTSCSHKALKWCQDGAPLPLGRSDSIGLQMDAYKWQ